MGSLSPVFLSCLCMRLWTSQLSFLSYLSVYVFFWPLRTKSSADSKSCKPGQTQNEVNFRLKTQTIAFLLGIFFFFLRFSVRLCVGSDAKTHMLVSFQNYYHTLLYLLPIPPMRFRRWLFGISQPTTKKMNYACDNPIGLPYTSITNWSLRKPIVAWVL